MSAGDAYYAGADIAYDAAYSACLAFDVLGEGDETSAAFYAADAACALDDSDEH